MVLDCLDGTPEVLDLEAGGFGRETMADDWTLGFLKMGVLVAKGRKSEDWNGNGIG